MFSIFYGFYAITFARLFNKQLYDTTWNLLLNFNKEQLEQMRDLTVLK